MRCAYCESVLIEVINKNKPYIRRFCDAICYHLFRKEKRPIEEHEAWQGGVSQTEAHRRWKAKNPERMAHLKARRYVREKNAQGQHSFTAWKSLVVGEGHRCVGCQKIKPLTKDHIIPLSKGGTDYIWNIQPLCRNCNSKKWANSTSMRILNCCPLRRHTSGIAGVETPP